MTQYRISIHEALSLARHDACMQHIEQSVIELDEQALKVTAARSCDAPREELWRAYTETDLLQRWWGPKHLLPREITWEPDPDHPWKIILESAEGESYEPHGTFLEVVPQERIVHTLELADHVEQPILVVAEFAALPQQASRFSAQLQFPSHQMFRKARDEHWEEVVTESLARLADLIARSR